MQTCCASGTCFSIPPASHSRALDESGLLSVQGLSGEVKVLVPKAFAVQVSVFMWMAHLPHPWQYSHTPVETSPNICFHKCSVLGTDYFEKL